MATSPSSGDSWRRICLQEAAHTHTPCDGVTVFHKAEPAWPQRWARAPGPCHSDWLRDGDSLSRTSTSQS